MKYWRVLKTMIDTHIVFVEAPTRREAKISALQIMKSGVGTGETTTNIAAEVSPYLRDN